MRGQKRHHQAVVISHPWQHQYQGNIGIKYHSSHSIERDAGGSESALRSSSQSICRSLRMTLELAKHQGFTSIQSTQISILVMSKILPSHMLQGNFATKKGTSLELKVNSVELSAFLQQKKTVFCQTRAFE
jgi:hypothetical protein